MHAHVRWRLNPATRPSSDRLLTLSQRSCWLGIHPLGVLSDHLLVGRDGDTVHLVGGQIALNPLNLSTQLLQDATRLLRNCLQVLGERVSSTGNITLYQVLWYLAPPLTLFHFFIRQSFKISLV